MNVIIKKVLHFGVMNVWLQLHYETTDGETFTIATTRPELIPAIVCIFVKS